MIKILNEAALKRENKEKSSKESDNCVPRNWYYFLPPDRSLINLLCFLQQRECRIMGQQIFTEIFPSPLE